MKTGDRLGPYELRGELGAGGMGVVYRAHDERLGREVAVKVLPADFASDSTRRARFELEARAIAALSHPSIVAIHDVGQQHEGAAYLVMELLEGQSLRERLASGPQPVRKVLAWGVQLAHGLAAAHDKGLVHRDLKPENLFITRDERLKVLDFGLARSTGDIAPPPGATLAQSQSGAVLGTAGYMSPEQVQGQSADARTDLFAFGAVLYEGLTGQRAFGGATPIDRGYAILNHEPKSLADSGVSAPPAVERIVRRCLEKSKAARFQSAHDLAFALEALTDGGSPTAVAPTPRRWPVALSALALAAAVAGVVTLTRKANVPAPVASLATPTAPSFTRLTFKDSLVTQARFGADHHTVYYSDSSPSAAAQTWVTSLGSDEARTVGAQGWSLADVTDDGELVLLRDGVLAVLHANSTAAPRAVLRDVVAASRGAAHSLVVIRATPEGYLVEYPPGQVRFSATDYPLTAPRVAPRNDGLAWLSRTVDYLALDAGAPRHLTHDRPGQRAITGLAWSPTPRELWYSATMEGGGSELRAVTLEGDDRLLLSAPGVLQLLDVAPNGNALIVQRNVARRVALGVLGQHRDRDVSILNLSMLRDLSADGQTILVNEQGGITRARLGDRGPGNSPGITSWLRRLDGGTTRLTSWMLTCLEPDATWAAGSPDNEAVVVVPTGAGEPRKLPRGPLKEIGPVRCARDGEHVVFGGTADPDGGLWPGGGWRLWAQSVSDGGLPMPISAVDTAGQSTKLSKKGELIIGHMGRPDVSDAGLVSLSGGPEQPLPGFPSDDYILNWSTDGRSVFVRRFEPKLPAVIYRYELSTRKMTPWLELSAPDAIHEFGIDGVMLSDDGKTYAYGYRYGSTTVYAVEGLR